MANPPLPSAALPSRPDDVDPVKLLVMHVSDEEQAATIKNLVNALLPTATGPVRVRILVGERACDPFADG